MSKREINIDLWPVAWAVIILGIVHCEIKTQELRYKRAVNVEVERDEK